MHDFLTLAIFYVFAGLAIASAFMVVTQNNPVRCVLFLVLTFFCFAVLWLLLKAEFLALILVLVYVGAVMTLFLFVVMMLDIETESIRSHFMRYLPFGLILVALLTGLLLIALPDNWHNNAVEKATTSTGMGAQDYSDAAIDIVKLSNTEEIGMVLYTDYVAAFELAAILLLVAIVSAITLAHRGDIRSKRQNVVKQIMTRKEDRVELISMKSKQ